MRSRDAVTAPLISQQVRNTR